jgi:hypothetical protein
VPSATAAIGGAGKPASDRQSHHGAFWEIFLHRIYEKATTDNWLPYFLERRQRRRANPTFAANPLADLACKDGLEIGQSLSRRAIDSTLAADFRLRKPARRLWTL